MLTLPQMLRRTPWCRRHGPREQPRRGRGVVNTSIWDFRRRGPLCNEVSYKLPMPWDSVAKQTHCYPSRPHLGATVQCLQVSEDSAELHMFLSTSDHFRLSTNAHLATDEEATTQPCQPNGPAHPPCAPCMCIASGLRSWHASQRTGWPVAHPCMANKAFRNRTACRHANQLSRRVAWDCDPPPIGPKHAKLMIRWF